MEEVDSGVSRFAVNWQYCGFIEAIDKLLDGDGCHCGGVEEQMNNRQ